MAGLEARRLYQCWVDLKVSAVRSFMTFEAPGGEPTDSATEEPAGRALADALARGAEDHGLLQEAVDQHDSYGWYFVAGTAGQRVWCMLQRSDQWLLITKPEIPFLKRLIGRRADGGSHRRVCEALHAGALGIPGVSTIRWFTEAEFQNQQPGAYAP